jgi:hypothetical protein
VVGIMLLLDDKCRFDANSNREPQQNFASSQRRLARRTIRWRRPPLLLRQAPKQRPTRRPLRCVLRSPRPMSPPQVEPDCFTRSCCRPLSVALSAQLAQTPFCALRDERVREPMSSFRPRIPILHTAVSGAKRNCLGVSDLCTFRAIRKYRGRVHLRAKRWAAPLQFREGS